MSTETARIVCLRSPSMSKNACRAAALRPAAHHTISPEEWSATEGQVALAAAVGDLIDPDRDQSLQPAPVEVIGQDPLDDLTDRVPADPEQPRDRCLGHLLRQPRDRVLEVPGIARAPAGPRHRLEL